MRVLFVASYYQPRYVRQAVLLHILQQSEHTVRTCIANGPRRLRLIRTLWRFVRMSKKNIDVVVIGYRGFEILLPIWLLTRRPIIFDAFISPYDTLVNDRQTLPVRSLSARCTYWMEKILYRLPRVTLFDTAQHADWIAALFRLPRRRFDWLPVGYDETLFRSHASAPTSKHITVFFYGTGLPLHGIEIVVQAAAALAAESRIQFHIVGPWPAAQLHGKNIQHTRWIPYEELPAAISEADICLAGHFSDVPKAARVVPGKAFQFLAMQRPIILGDNPANRSLFSDQECRYVPMHDAAALADAIRMLAADPTLRTQLADAGHYRVQEIQRGLSQRIYRVINAYVTA